MAMLRYIMARYNMEARVIWIVPAQITMSHLLSNDKFC